MLLDAAMIQEADARYIARLIERGRARRSSRSSRSTTRTDVATVLAQMVGLPYRRRQTIAPGVAVTFLDAGHVLGSAIVVLDVEDDGQTLRLVFTGDLGRHHLPILRDPEVPGGVDVPAHREHLRRSAARPDRAAGRRAGRGAPAHPRARRQGRHPVVRARARAGGGLRAQAAPRAAAASRRCRSTSTRR